MLPSVRSLLLGEKVTRSTSPSVALKRKNCRPLSVSACRLPSTELVCPLASKNEGRLKSFSVALMTVVTGSGVGVGPGVAVGCGPSLAGANMRASKAI